VGEYAGFSTSNIDRAIEAGLTFRPLADTAVATMEYWDSLDEERRSKTRAGCPPELEEKVLKAWHEKKG
jgi:2'-hydroxyisoflavone reductase